MKLINIFRKIINPIGLDLKIYPSTNLRRRKKIIEHYNITKIFDVGANSGQYAIEMLKDLKFKGIIISFEPVKTTFNKLKKNSKKYSNWKSFNFGLGDKEETLNINLSQNTFSSSFLEILSDHVSSAPESKVVGTEEVSIKKIDNIYDELVDDKDVVLLKIDVQGFEKNVLDGAKKSLNKIKCIQIEMSIEELYKNEMLFEDMLNYLNKFGFQLCSLENGFYNEKSGKLLQVDGIFYNKSK